MRKLRLLMVFAVILPVLASCAAEKGERGDSQRRKEKIECACEHRQDSKKEMKQKGDKKPLKKFLFENKELNITEAQKKEIKEISQNLKIRGREIRKEMKTDIKTLDSIMVGGVFSEEAFIAITDSIEKHRTAMAKNRRELFLEVYKILDQNQREKFLPLFREYIRKGPHQFKLKHRKMSCDIDSGGRSGCGCDCSGKKQ